MPFPPSPYLGQLFSDGCILYKWNGVTWSRVLGTYAPQSTEDPSEPSYQDLVARIAALEQQIENDLNFLVLE